MQARPSSRILPLALALLAAGCADEWRPRTADGPVAARHGGDAANAARLVGGMAPSGPSRSAGVGFARLPDRGDLVGYPAQRIARRDGAYTWHRADLSEAHALAAIADGSLRITTPAGETLDFVYERHEEHPSGDWTWVGRLERGSAADEVVLTFGDRAAFGTIAQPGKEPLRLTVRDGAAWLIETDASRVADIRNRATQPKGPDYLVPPSGVSSREADTSASGPAMASAPSTAAATSSSGPVIDLVLGYTPGFATMYGGQSQAVTRLNNMVAITNEAYANSQIAGRVRLVHTLQVSYADNTNNGDALEKLTGYKSGTGWVKTDPAFSALRAARDQYGADLVSLVRKFNDPENDGCGIAWMIGGGGSRVDTGDEPFGYSVVSDGEDQGTDGKTYFCRHETLAHEIGHNLGSQHDKATATKDGKVSQGAYSYSFGYKTDSANGNFYTVMAYGDSGQTRYRVFSNPRTTFCGGRACGVSDQSDNARSQEQTMPTIASFRSTAVLMAGRAKYDFNGDGKDDVVWRNLQTGANVVWLGASSSIVQALSTVVNQNWKIAGAADFDADGRADLLWRNSATGANAIWRSASSAAPMTVSGASLDWKIAGLGDFDGDGRADILWRSGSDGRNVIWPSANAAASRSITTVTSLAWRVAGIGDFNADARDDVMWRNTSTGANAIWLSASSGTQQAVSTVPSLAWQISAVADFDGDGRDDIAWRNSGTGANSVWRSGNSSTQQAISHVPNLSWKIVAASDYDGDGVDDLLWRNSSTGSNTIWRRANSAMPLAVAALGNVAWTVQ
jgi:hypothetical protein